MRITMSSESSEEPGAPDAPEVCPFCLEKLRTYKTHLYTDGLRRKYRRCTTRSCGLYEDRCILTLERVVRCGS